MSVSGNNHTGSGLRGGEDSGTPIVVSEPGGPHGEAFHRLAEAVAGEVEKHKTPKVSII